MKYNPIAYFALGCSITLCKGKQTESNFYIHQGGTQLSTTAYIFAHGLGSNRQQGINLFAKDPKPTNLTLAKPWIVGDPLIVFDFPDAEKKEDTYKAQYVNFGQKRDLERFKDIYHKAIEIFPNHQFVLVGLSRGGATILNYMALCHSLQDNVKALIIESSFDTMKTVIKHLMQRFFVHWLPFAKNIGLKIAQNQFIDFDMNGFFPIDHIAKISRQIPILFVHSKKDRIVPIKSSRRLYLLLKSMGYEHVYLLELEDGMHGKLMKGPDAHTYQNTVHAFYQKYNLPHDYVSAQRGFQTLLLCQPSITEVMARLQKN